MKWPLCPLHPPSQLPRAELLPQTTSQAVAMTQIHASVKLPVTMLWSSYWKSVNQERCTSFGKMSLLSAIWGCPFRCEVALSGRCRLQQPHQWAGAGRGCWFAWFCISVMPQAVSMLLRPTWRAGPWVWTTGRTELPSVRLWRPATTWPLAGLFPWTSVPSL